MSGNSEQTRHGTGGKLGEVAGRSNSGKPILHTIDPDFILGIARVSAFGAQKYHMRNFLMAPGMTWSTTYESALRHLFAWWGGEGTDEESGMPHLLHASWNLMALYTYSHRGQYAPGDDRPASLEYLGLSWKDWEARFEEVRTRKPEQETPQDIVNDAKARLDAQGYSGSISLKLAGGENVIPFGEKAS